MLRFVLLLFFTGWCMNASAVQTTGHSLLVVGDSISAAHGISPDQGWVQLLATKITQENLPYQVINASISGDTSIGGLNRLPELLKRHRPAVILIELGGNDGLRGLSLTVMQQNLQQMISMSKATKACVILAGMKIPPNYGKRYTDAFIKVYTDLAHKEQVELIPFLLEGVGGVAELMQADGIHPNEKAQPLIMQTVWSSLQTCLIH